MIAGYLRRMIDTMKRSMVVDEQHGGVVFKLADFPLGFDTGGTVLSLFPCCPCSNSPQMQW